MFQKTYSLGALNAVTDFIQAGSRINSAGIIAFQLIDGGAWNGTVTFQAALDPTDTTNVVPIAAVEVSDPATAATTAAAGAKIWRVDASGGVRVRLKVTTYVAGAMTVRVSASDG